MVAYSLFDRTPKVSSVVIELCLLGTPRDLHIPYFAMGTRHTRENSATRLSIERRVIGACGEFEEREP